MTKTKPKKSDLKKSGPKKDKARKSQASAKEIAGLKVPKVLRKFGPIKDLLTSDLGREILADALIAAAGAAAAALTRTRPAKEAGASAKSVTQDVVHTASGVLAGVVTDAARRFLPATLGGEDNGEASPAPAAKAAPARAARKPAGTSRKGPAAEAATKRPGAELTDTTGQIPSEG